MNRVVDLTEGKITRNLIIFCIPIFAGLVFQNLYNTVDSIVVGRFVGTDALSAVNVCGNVTNLLVGFFMGLSTGASVVFSRYYSMKSNQKLHDSIHTTVLFTIIFALVVTGIALYFSKTILGYLNCPNEVFDDALNYMRIYLIGVIFIGLYNVLSGVLRSVGDSQTPFYCLVISSISNIILDILFVVIIQMGVKGVGVATVIAQMISSAFLLKKLMTTKESYRLILSDLSINFDILREVISIGLPAAIQTTIQSISNIFVQRYINSFGSFAISGIGSAMRIDQFACMAPQSLGLGLTTYVSQNLGANKKDRVKQGVRIGTLLCVVIVAITSIPIYIFANSLMHIFTTDQNVIIVGTNMLRTIMPLYEFMGLQQLIGGVVRGYGKSFQVMCFNIFGMVVFRQIYLYIGLVIFHQSIQYIYWCYPICWIISTVLTYLYYFIYTKKEG